MPNTAKGLLHNQCVYSIDLLVADISSFNLYEYPKILNASQGRCMCEMIYYSIKTSVWLEYPKNAVIYSISFVQCENFMIEWNYLVITAHFAWLCQTIYLVILAHFVWLCQTICISGARMPVWMCANVYQWIFHQQHLPRYLRESTVQLIPYCVKTPSMLELGLHSTG